ncbi:MAG: HDOD domain-containing protein [Pseudomonadota bacterium]
MRNLPEPIALAIESGRLPSPPQVLLKLMHTIEREDATLGEIAALVEQDSGLSTRVLSVANSAALRRGLRMASIENCLNTLGTRMVRAIATCLSIQSLFDREGALPADMLARFWAHALLVAELAREIAATAGYARPDEAHLAGLLHDVGQLILLNALGDPYRQALAEDQGDTACVVREQARFGVHHGEVGAWLADRWDLDSAFADSLLFHHADPALIGSATLLPRIVWYAERLASHSTPDQVACDTRVLLGASFDLPGLCERAEERTRTVAAALGLVIPDQLFGEPVWYGLPPAAPAAPEDEMALLLGGMALMQPLQQDLISLDSHAEILASLRASARILFGLEHTAFLLIEPSGETLVGAEIEAQPSLFREARLPIHLATSLAARAVLERTVTASFGQDPLASPSLTDLQFARALGASGLLCIPMLARDRALGVMVFGVSQALYQKLATRLPWLLNFGRIAGNSLDALKTVLSYRHQAHQAAAGQFERQARRIVHEAENPLGIIRSYLKILDRKLPDETGVRKELSILHEEIDRISGIVGRMSEMPDVQRPAGIDLSALIDELLLLYGDALFRSRGIQVETRMPEQPVQVAGDRNSLKQILINLWKNASQALAQGGHVIIRLQDPVFHEGQAMVRLVIEDDGPGLPESALRGLHRPLAQAGDATHGIGLTLVGELARRQGIALTSYNRARQGTVFALLLPRPARPAQPTRAPATGDPA